MNLQAGRGFQMELNEILRSLMKGDCFLLTLVSTSRLFSMLFITTLYGCRVGSWCVKSLFSIRETSKPQDTCLLTLFLKLCWEKQARLSPETFSYVKRWLICVGVVDSRHHGLCTTHVWVSRLEKNYSKRNQNSHVWKRCSQFCLNIKKWKNLKANW